MKILIVSDGWLPQLNGVVRTYQYLTAELEKLGHEIKVIGPADFPLRLPTPGYSEIELALLPYGRLKKLARRFVPDHVHIATEGPLGRAAHKYCLRKHKQPFTTSYHSHFPDYIAARVAKFAPFLAPLARKRAINSLRRFHNKAHGLMVATDSLEEELRSWGFTVPMHRLTRGVPDIFTPEGARVMEDLPKPIALYVGRVAIEKNLEDFLAMDWDGSKVIIGHGPATDELKAKFPAAHFLGKREGEELAAYFRSADVFVFPSRTDTFGIVLIEALASGTPVAAYDVTGPRDIITAPMLGCLNDDLSKAAKDAIAYDATPEQRHLYTRGHYSWPAVGQQFMTAVNTAMG